MFRSLIRAFLLVLIPSLSLADDGYRLWLKYDPVKDPGLRESYRRAVSSILVEGTTEVEKALAGELENALDGLLQGRVPRMGTLQDGALVVGTPKTSPTIKRLKWDKALEKLGDEGYLLKSAVLDGKVFTVVAANSPAGALYGSFHFLRLLQTNRPIDSLDLADAPKVKLRLLNHWDNLNGTIERGYAGGSLWDWEDLPANPSPRLVDYARANASLGINGTVLNNVNAAAEILTEEYLKKVAALADLFRPWGLKVYLSANFAAPKRIGGLTTSDPLDPKVREWWKRKADEIYSLIPDFGGFLVKANSEGQSGPQDYGRTHRQGAEMLARALKPHGGVVMWRAFVYNADLDHDRINRAYLEFRPEDGKFPDNVLIQAKNGALDFQPREPFHPLFGGMKKTPVLAELQVTQEYLGHSTHLAYLAPMWEEFFKSETYAKGKGSSVAKVVQGEVFPYKWTGVAGVANTGTDRNWTGHPLAQANWHAFGRMAWDPESVSEELAEEWIRMTLTNDPETIVTVASILMASREAFVDYVAPLGLAGVFEKDVHYAPDPGMVDPRREDWSAAYYVRAGPDGIGFDRTRNGSGNVDQYHKPLSDAFNGFGTCPDKFLLWFHHVPWERRMKSGRTLWEELCASYDRGVKRAQWMQKEWKGLGGRLDGGIHGAVSKRLRIQVKEAKEWRLKVLKYFQGFSNLPLPEEVKQK